MTSRPSFSRQPMHPHHAAALAVFLGVICVSAMTLHETEALHASIADSEDVCVQVAVIGVDNGDPGSGGCTPVPVSSSSASSSIASSSSAASSLSSVASSASSMSSEIVAITPSLSPTEESQAYRHDRSYWTQHINDLIQTWSARHVAHGAAPAACGAAPYDDVHAPDWFFLPVRAFYGAGYLDTSVCLFRPAEIANRAEFAKLLVTMAGGVYGGLPARSSFTDVSTSVWYFPFVEEAGRSGWMIGFQDCYGTLPCFDRPAKAVTRAEAAQMIVRYFAFDRTGLAPNFADNDGGQWYARSIQVAADHCVLLGDDDTGTVRPNAPLNRAEMVTMLARAELHLTYGTDCGSQPASHIQSHAPIHVASSGALAISDPWSVCTGNTFLCVYEEIRSKTASIGRSWLFSLFSARP